MAAEDRKRYEKECDQLRTLGYFINSEGVKSTELVKKLTKAQREAKKADQTKKTQSQNEDREVAGWTLFYQSNFQATWGSHSRIKDQEKRKAVVDENLQKQWLNLTEAQKEEMIEKACGK